MAADQARRALLELANGNYQRVVVDVETAVDKDAGYEPPRSKDLLCVGLAYAPNRVVIISQDSLQDPTVREALRLVLETKSITCQNGRFDLGVLHDIAPNAKLTFDTMLASYAECESGQHGLKYLATEILGAPDYAKEMKQYKNYADAPKDILYLYNSYDCALTWQLQDYYEANLDDDGKRLHHFLVSNSNALMPMEREGIRIDEQALKEAEVEYSDRLEELELGLSRWVGNPRSPLQISRAFSKLGIDLDSTDAAHLNAVVEQVSKPEVAQFATKLLQYRVEHKLFSTYITGIGKRLYAGRLFPTFLLHGTVTGRLACRNPNLFNIPRGSVIRKLFVPEPGNVWVQCDFSQVELRVVACLSQDSYLQAVFRDPSRDIHTEVAKMCGITRQQAKPIVYGCVPMDTEALTRQGWKQYEQISTEDEVLGYKDGVLQWVPVLSKVKYDDAPIQQLKNRHFQARTTPNHRWWGSKRTTARAIKSLFFRTEDITTEHTIQLSAKAETPHRLPITADEAAIIAWLKTDGHIKRGKFTGGPSQGAGTRVAFQASIFQSRHKFVDEIAKVLIDAPHYVYDYSKRPCVEFRLEPNYARDLWGRARLDEISLEQFVLELGTEERAAFFDACFKAEGTTSKSGQQVLTQNGGPVLEAMKLAAFLEGYFPTASLGYSAKDCYKLRLSAPKVTGQRLRRQDVGREAVWCITTPVESWVMRQRGQIMLTGNTTYGMEAKHFAGLLGITESRARQLQNQFFSVIPGVVKWKSELKRSILTESNDLVTPYGRHRRFWLITKENQYDVVKEGTAFLPQSIASDICLTALTRLLEKGYKCRLSVYDSIMAECAPEDVEDVSRAMNAEMEQAGREYSEFVPFVTETKVGKNWGVFG